MAKSKRSFRSWGVFPWNFQTIWILAEVIPTYLGGLNNSKNIKKPSPKTSQKPSHASCLPPGSIANCRSLATISRRTTWSWAPRSQQEPADAGEVLLGCDRWLNMDRKWYIYIINIWWWTGRQFVKKRVLCFFWHIGIPMRICRRMKKPNKKTFRSSVSGYLDCTHCTPVSLGLRVILGSSWFTDGSPEIPIMQIPKLPSAYSTAWYCKGDCTSSLPIHLDLWEVARRTSASVLPAGCGPSKGPHQWPATGATIGIRGTVGSARAMRRWRSVSPLEIIV